MVRLLLLSSLNEAHLGFCPRRSKLAWCFCPRSTRLSWVLSSFDEIRLELLSSPIEVLSQTPKSEDCTPAFSCYFRDSKANQHLYPHHSRPKSWWIAFSPCSRPDFVSVHADRGSHCVSVLADQGPRSFTVHPLIFVVTFITQRPISIGSLTT